MRQRLISTAIIFLSTIIALTVQVSAAPATEGTLTGYLHQAEPPEPAPYPTTVQMVEHDNMRTLYKTFTVPDGTLAAELVEEDFDQEGYRYRFREIVPEESTPAETTKPVIDRVTLETDTGELEETLALFDRTIPYLDDEGYSGELILLPETITILEAGRIPYAHTITEEREYTDLERNDPALLPGTIFVEGSALSLKGVNWSVGDYQADGAVRYNAVATYTGLVSGANITGYIATAFYGGDAIKPLPVYHTYTVVYEGEPIPVREPPEPAVQLPDPPKDHPVLIFLAASAPYIVSTLIVCGCIALTRHLYHTMTNAQISSMRGGVPTCPRRVRINPDRPVLHLGRYKTGARIVIDRRLQQALLDRDSLLFVRGRYQNYHFPVSQGLAFALPAQEGPVKYNHETEGGDAT